MLRIERQRAISQHVTQQGAVNVAELADQFGVSVTTIRRDLEQLEKEGGIHRIHGGAMAPGVPDLPSDVSLAGQVSHTDLAIGRAASDRVCEGETVFLGPGRLPLLVAHALASKKRITVITNGLDIAYWLAHNTDLIVILTGGAVGRPGNGLSGSLVDHALRTLSADRIIFEATGLSPDQGVMSSDLEQAVLGRELLAAPGEAIVLVSPGRVGRVGGVLVGPADEVDVVITGRQADQASLWDLSQLGVAILSV